MPSITRPVPKLAPPGAGLPFWQGLASRHVLFPLFNLSTSWDRARERFEEEGVRILDITQGMSDAGKDERVLVPPILGLEDSSRFWSIAMTIEHLLIVGQGMAQTIIGLSHGRTIDRKVEIAAVKPKGALTGRQCLEAFEAFVPEFLSLTTDRVKDRDAKATLEHPWFGPLTAKQWMCLSALHQRIHRRQIEEILKRLPC